MTVTSQCHLPLPPHLVHTLELLRGGMTQREMAAELGVSFNTVHKYVQEIYQHFGVRGRVQLLSWMLEPPVAADKRPVTVTLPRRPKRAGPGVHQSSPPHLMK